MLRVESNNKPRFRTYHLNYVIIYSNTAYVNLSYLLFGVYEKELGLIINQL